jgi:adenosylhomocysteine nucleosidase
VNEPIIVSALREEFYDQSQFDGRIYYTGIGKINTSHLITKLILTDRPTGILNLGTAGTLNPDLLGKCVGVKTVLERDMNAEPLAPRGEVPFDSRPTQYFSDLGTETCASGDSFLTQSDPWLSLRGVSLVDMELFAIAKICFMYGIPWRSVKYVSDSIDSTSDTDWHKALGSSSRELSEFIRVSLDKEWID